MDNVQNKTWEEKDSQDAEHTYFLGGNSQVGDGSLILQVETRGKSSDLATSHFVLLSLNMLLDWDQMINKLKLYPPIHTIVL